MFTLLLKPAPAPTEASSPSRLSGSQRFLIVVSGYFLVAGVATIMLGPALPLLASRWSMPDSSLGSLFVAYFAGQFCGSWLATPRVRASLLLGSLVAAIGISLLAFVGAATALVALFLAGLGIGAGLTAGNVLVGAGGPPLSGSDGRRSARSRNLALLNVAWGLGAIACPVLLDASLPIHGSGPQSGGLFFTLLAAAFAVSAVFLWVLLPSDEQRLDTLSEKNQGEIPWRIFALFGIIFMLYVGVENSLAGWLPAYAQRSSPGGVAAGRAPAIAMCFWIFELASRVLTASLIHLFRERLFYRICLLVLLATTVAFELIPHLGTNAIFAVTAVAALSLAPLYPLAASFLLEHTGNHPRVGRVFACASLGGTLLPWLTGVLSTHFHSLRIGLATPALGAALLLLLSFQLPRAIVTAQTHQT